MTYDDIPETLDDEQKIQLAVSRALTSAADWVDEELSPVRTKYTEYYLGMPFGDEEEGRSKVVSRDVSDTVRAILPSLVRVFTGSEKPLEFVPQGPEDVMMAEQATDYVNYVLMRDNDGFSAIYSAFEDALVRGTGIIKTWWDDSIEITMENYEGLDDDTLTALGMDIEIEVIEQISYEDPDARIAIDQMVQQQQEMLAMLQAQGQEVPPEMAQMEPPPVPMLHDVTVRRSRQRGRIRAEAVPPEEILISRGARSWTNADLVAHRTEKTESELVAMGYDPEDIQEFIDTDELRSNEERITRHPEEFANNDNLEVGRILYTEAWMPLDIDGDGIAELRKVCCLGEQYVVKRIEFAPYVPIAHFCPYPEPHRAIGRSVAELVMDVQRIKSQIMRNMLDSLAQSIHPRTGVVEGQVNMDDVLNNEVGGVIRMRAPGMVQPLDTPFVGQQAFPMLQYMDQLKERRTGITDATQGLDAETLQSTTAVAVQATVQAAQQQIELIARQFAETGMRQLYRNLLRLMVRYQDKPRMVRLRNNWVPMDPRTWNSDMDVTITTAVSDGLSQDRIQTLMMVLQKQEQILQTVGPNNPIVTLAQYANTLRKTVEVAGFKDAGMFFNEVPPDFQMPDQDPAQSSPEAILAEVQREAIQADIQKKQADMQLDAEKTRAELDLKREQMLRNDDRERDRMEADVVLRATKIQAEHGIPVDINAIFALMQRNRERMMQ